MLALLLLLAVPCRALTVPPPLVHDAALIAATQARARAGDPAVLASVATAVRWAEAALTAGPYTVTACPHPAPDGDPRSYVSIAKYYWPCGVALSVCGAKPAPPAACGADGLPWLNCDGHVNPIIDEYSAPIVANMTAAVSTLATAYLFSGRADFAARAALLLRAFFTDGRTGMHPALDYAQAEPGSNNGSHWGVIELSDNFVATVLDSISFIAPSGAWTDADQAAMLAWLAGMAAWLRGSALGRQEAVAFNNHQIYYTVMAAGIDVWLGDTAHAVALLRGTLEPPPAGNAFAPLGMQIAADGELPAEEARTNSGGYVNFATMALLKLGAMARTPALVAAGAPDLLAYVTHSNHSSIKNAVDFMVPFVSGANASWPFQNITKTPWSIFTEQYRRAASVAGWEASRATYAATVTTLQERADDPMALFWPLDAAASSSTAPAVGAAAAAAAASATLTVAGLLHKVDAAFLGVNIDSASLTNGIDLDDAYLGAMAAQLARAANSGGGSPMHLRVGGSASNGIVYIANGVPGRSPRGATVVTDASLAALNAFAARAGARITFCIPYQTENGAWAPAINASALWAMVAARNLTSFAGWSLGNELIGGMTPGARAQYAQDYVAFRAAVSAQAPAWAQGVVGPSAAGWPGDDVMDGFLAANAATAMELSIHAYSFSNCSLSAYMDKAGIERMAHYYSAFVAARDAHAPAMPVYLEEMATQAGGGCDGLSNRFVSGFWFVHALGLAGQMGIARVTRQDLAGWSFTSGVSHYTLAGQPGWVNASGGSNLPTPHPDWYTALLWRQVVGAAVLASHLDAPAVNSTFAAHAWCASGGGGAVVLAYINLHAAPVALALAGIGASPRVEFILTPPAGNLTADTVLLNGAMLAVDAAGELPAIPVPGKAVPAGGDPLVLPPTSYGFVTLPEAKVKDCE